MAAEAAISTTVKLLGNLLIEKVKFIRGVKDQLQALKDELTRMQSFLKDANKRQANDENVRNWISEIRELALDTEDTIEMFILNLETAKSRGLLERCVHFPKHVHHLNKIGKEIESILARLAKIGESRVRYGIQAFGDSGEPPERSVVEARRRLVSWGKDEHLVGVETDVRSLLYPIMGQKDKGLSITAIVGMGGSGKSTLAREVYKHPCVVSGRFDCRAWVVVSSEFTLLETIKQLILETTGSKQQKQDRLDEIKKLEDSMRNRLYLEETFKEMLQRQLEGKTYFIVLDDVWEMKDFVSLKTIFPNEQDKVSRLLLTTRNKVIANHCQRLHEMKFLDSKDSWELFLKKGLGNSNEEFPKELEQVGRHIIKKCEGLPLAIIVMGGLLVETRSNRAWEEALNQLDSHLERAESSIIAIAEAILEMSYENLSPQLKSCFLCLAFFKEDATIPVKRLVNIMVGQDLIHQTERATVEEIARGYIDELINRNMVQAKDFKLDYQVKSCHLHDSLYKICLKKAKEQIGLVHQIEGHRISSHKPRHLVVECNNLGSFLMNQNMHIRSFFLLNVGEDFRAIKSSYWKSFQNLKNLDLEGCNDLQRLPDSFRLLRGLKQLRIRVLEYGKCIELPTWLNTLKRLEILDFSGMSAVFPNVGLEMNSLRHIYARKIRGVMITVGWKNVETLKYIMYENWMRSSLKMKEDVCRIQKLGIHLEGMPLQFRNDEDSSRMKTSLEKLENLVKLYFYWDPIYHPLDATIIIPHLNTLTTLRLRGRMRKCPSASMFPPNLSHLTLAESYLSEDPMQELSKLPKLSYLKLKWSAYDGESMQVSHDGFPSLKGLYLQGLYDLRSVEVEEGGMPLLKLLQVGDCRRLNTNNLYHKSYQLRIQNRW